MRERIECASCGYTGPAEEVVEGLSVCPTCGEHVESSEPTASPLHRTRFHYRSRTLGPVGRVIDKFRPSPIRDETDRPIGRVRHRPSLRRLMAQVAGAVFLTAAIVGLVSFGANVSLPWLLMAVVMYAGLLFSLVGSLVLTTMLSTGPDILVLAVGDDPRLLLRLRPLRDTLFTSTLRIEDGDGAALGQMRLHRLRAFLLLNPGRGAIVEVEPTRGEAFLARRPGLGRGWTFELDEGVIGGYALDGGLIGRDLLVIEDPSPLDPRLFVAAVIAGRE